LQLDFQFDNETLKPSFAKLHGPRDSDEKHLVYALELFVDDDDSLGQDAEMEEKNTKFKFLFIYDKKYGYKDQNDEIQTGYPWCFINFSLEELIRNYDENDK
jgi:hypothetical protein